MKRPVKLSLFVKVLIAIALGALVGCFVPTACIRALKTFNVLFSQLLKFIVPLLILGLVTPAIADVGKGAGKMLLLVMAGAYASSVAAGFFAWGISSSFFPHVLPQGIAEVAKGTTIEPYFKLAIPPVCDVMTALPLSFILGIGMSAVGAKALKTGFDQFGAIVQLTITKVIIPLLPIYIFTMIAEMAAAGRLAAVLGQALTVILTGVAISILFLIVEYTLAALIAGRNPVKCLWNMLPAYLTAFSISSSAPVIPVTLVGVKKNGVSNEIADFIVPLCANVHMPGSVIKMATTLTAVAWMTDFDMTFALFANFVLMQCISAVAAPGIPTGVLMTSIGLLTSIVGFTEVQTGLLTTIYLALDGYGPACSVTADGALALAFDRFFGKKHAA